jgi:hypothetical protein
MITVKNLRIFFRKSNYHIKCQAPLLDGDGVTTRSEGPTAVMLVLQKVGNYENKKYKLYKAGVISSGMMPLNKFCENPSIPTEATYGRGKTVRLICL